MRKSKNYRLLFMTMLIITCLSCEDDDTEEDIGNWAERSTFNEEPRSSAAAFTIGDKGYMGTGYDGDDYLKDFGVMI